jgi:ArsR family transcriptional regulator
MIDKYEQASEVFQLLSHPARLQILDELRRDPACVCHLEAILNRPQAYVSQQLRVLREAGAVSDRRDGLFVTYRLVDDQVEQLLEEVLGPAGGRTEPVACPCPRCDAE